MRFLLHLGLLALACAATAAPARQPNFLFAKLIKYSGHDEWTGLFDLAADPFETKNLVRDPQSRALLARMQSEFDRQVTETGFVIPDYAHQPGETPTKKGRKQ